MPERDFGISARFSFHNIVSHLKAVSLCLGICFIKVKVIWLNWGIWIYSYFYFFYVVTYISIPCIPKYNRRHKLLRTFVISRFRSSDNFLCLFELDVGNTLSIPNGTDECIDLGLRLYILNPINPKNQHSNSLCY